MNHVLVAAAAATLAQPVSAAPTLDQTFVSACLDGSVRLSKSEAQAIGFDALPKVLREPLGAPANSRVWKLYAGSDSYLYLLDYAGPTGTVQVCGLASDSLPLAAAKRAIAARLGVSVDENDRDSTEWYVAASRSRALATRVRGYTTLQVNQLPAGETQ